MAAPRASFVIPARNAQATLERTLDSVLAQTDTDWEALLVDDGSSDETPQLIESWCARDGRFVALSTGSAGSQGVSAARNAGIARARGERLVFLDSDDWLDASFLQVMHAALDAAPDALAAYCDYQRVWPDGQAATVPSDEGLASSPVDTFARTCAVAIHAVLVPRDAVLHAGGFDTALRTCEDWDLWQRVARLGGRWVHVARPLACYRLHAGSLSQDMAQAQADGAVVIRRAYGADKDGVDVALAYHALWCHAFALVRRLGADTPAVLRALPADDEHALYIAQTLADAAALALLVAPQELARREAQHGPPIAALIAALGSLWGDSAAAQRVQHTYARLVASLDAPHGSTTVGCVVPAYNAEATLDETLRSVRTQTHRALEIIVVDDGSTDGTRAVVERHAADDARVRLLRQANAGVAAARNAGWQASRADLIAFIDADDLWAPTKIERQLAALQAAGPRAGLAYCWVCEIDSTGRVLQQHERHHHEGAVLDAIVRSNFLGCGSTPLVRRQALADAGGFDPRLHAAGAQGCEDWLLYARVAAAYDYAVAPEYLVGYRLRENSMSSDRSAMLRSHVLMCEQMAALSPAHRRALLAGLRDYCATLLGQTPHAHVFARASLLWAVRDHPTVWLRTLCIDLPRQTWRRLRARFARSRGPLPSVAPSGPLFLPPSS
jgi:glycosyltransferase involved in cell wall biosynthesis